MMAISCLSFLIINVKYEKYFVLFSTPSSIDSSLSVQSGKFLSTSRSHVLYPLDNSQASRDEELIDTDLVNLGLRTESKEEQVSVVPSEPEHPSWRLLYCTLFVVCFMSNGFLPSISVSWHNIRWHVIGNFPNLTSLDMGGGTNGPPIFKIARFS